MPGHRATFGGGTRFVGALFWLAVLPIGYGTALIMATPEKTVFVEIEMLICWLILLLLVGFGTLFLSGKPDSR
jgi:hypothetical protein